MSDSEEDKNLPPADECDRRCKEFAEVTGTDSALAMFYLQDRDWDLDRALNSYFEESAASQGPTSVIGIGPGAELALTNSSNSATSAILSAAPLVDEEPHRIRLISWNIDGLDKQNHKSRTEGVALTINKEKPHVVFLQECIEATEEILQSKCPAYHMIPGNDDSYYTMMLLQTGHVEVEDTKILPFPNTSMGRNLLAVKCRVKGEKFWLITTHLESTKDYGAERKKQLKNAFQFIQELDKDRTVVFGGDLNLRDKELVEIGGLPENMFDIWEITGKRPEAKFTWDMQRNDNLEWATNFKPKCRFDRLYIKHSSPHTVKPAYFELTGLERLKSCQRFCSDHWGLLTHLNILSRLPK